MLVHKFLVHKRGDHVGVATSDISKDESVSGFYMDDDSRIEVTADCDIPLGHKISVSELPAGGEVIEYGTRIGLVPDGLSVGDYVHTHNIKSARW